MKEPSKEQIKERAKFLRQVLLEKHKIDLPHGHSLEVLAKVFGFKDWNTASALSAEVSSEKHVTDTLVTKTNDEKPIATKFQTVGEAIEFLSKFNKETKLFVNEYKWTESDFGTVTSVCSLTFDSEIQNGTDLYLELNTETERNDTSFGKSSSQTFERTAAGRSQRRIKYLYMQDGFWSSRLAAKS